MARKYRFFKGENIYFFAIAFFLSITVLIVTYVLIRTNQKKADIPIPSILGVVDEKKEKDDGVVRESTKNPEESVVKKYTVANDLPELIHIPKLQRIGYIQSVGVDQNKQIAVPDNIYMAGWYVNSVKPGEKGLSILDGHRDGVWSKGVFIDIEKLKKGDKIEIRYGDKRVIKFTVKKVVQVEEKDAMKILFSKDMKISHQLNLISCTGVYSEATLKYDKRVIVVASKD